MKIFLARKNHETINKYFGEVGKIFKAVSTGNAGTFL